MHAIIAAVVGVLIGILLARLFQRRKAVAQESGFASTVQTAALVVDLAGLTLIALAWIGVAGLAFGPWLVWAALALYLVATVVRAVKRVH